MINESWVEFRDTGLFWWVNMILHTFGWAIIMKADADGNVVDVYPQRVKYRGFSEKSNTKGYIKVSDYMSQNGETLLRESKEE